MRIRPGRTRSLIAGIAALVVTAVGLLMMSSLGQFGGFGSPMPGMGGVFGIFKIVWLAIGLIGAGVSFYNAFSRKGVPLYEIETDQEQSSHNGDQFCPQCGRPISSTDRFCRHCGTQLKS